MPSGQIDDYGSNEEVLASLMKSGTSHWCFDYPLSVSLRDEQATPSTGLVPSNLSHVVLKAEFNDEILQEEVITDLKNQKQLRSMRISGVDIFSKASDNGMNSVPWGTLNTIRAFY